MLNFQSQHSYTKVKITSLVETRYIERKVSYNQWKSMWWDDCYVYRNFSSFFYNLFEVKVWLLYGTDIWCWFIPISNWKQIVNQLTIYVYKFVLYQRENDPIVNILIYRMLHYLAFKHVNVTLNVQYFNGTKNLH